MKSVLSFAERFTDADAGNEKFFHQPKGAARPSSICLAISEAVSSRLAYHWYSS